MSCQFCEQPALLQYYLETYGAQACRKQDFPFLLRASIHVNAYQEDLHWMRGTNSDFTLEEHVGNGWSFVTQNQCGSYRAQSKRWIEHYTPFCTPPRIVPFVSGEIDPAFSKRPAPRVAWNTLCHSLLCKYSGWYWNPIQSVNAFIPFTDLSIVVKAGSEIEFTAKNTKPKPLMTRTRNAYISTLL